MKVLHIGMETFIIFWLKAQNSDIHSKHRESLLFPLTNMSKRFVGKTSLDTVRQMPLKPVSTDNNNVCYYYVHLIFS